MTRRQLPQIYEFDPGYRIRTVVIAGAGGTGAQLARLVARLLYDMKAKRLSIPALHLYDPDTVEARNLGRQLFTAGDIGGNKAEVVASRLNLALGLDIHAVPARIDAHNVRTVLATYYGTPQTLVIGALDQVDGRRAIAACVEQCVAWIDCGNHEHGGQVAIGNRACADRTAYTPSPSHAVRHLPAPHILFPGLLAPDPEPRSCADLAAQNQQALFVNDWMAIAAVSYVRKLLMREPITHFITYVDTLNNSVRSVPITQPALCALLPAPQTITEETR